MGNVAQISEQTFEAEVLKSATPVLVDFFATWCGPCKALAPVVEEIAKDLGAKLKVVKIDVDDAQDTAASFGVTALPTLVLFKGGKEAFRRVGAAPKRDLMAAIEGLV